MNKPGFWHVAASAYLGKRLTAPFLGALGFLALREGWVTFLYGVLILGVALLIAAIPWIIDYRKGDL
jgi:hypothetical protein